MELANETGFAVDVRLFYADQQELPKEIIEADGTEVSVTVAAGATFTITRNCDDLQAIFIDNATLLDLFRRGRRRTTRETHVDDD